MLMNKLSNDGVCLKYHVIRPQHEVIRAIYVAQGCFGLLIISEQRETLTEYGMKNKLFTATVRCLCPIKVNTETVNATGYICLNYHVIRPHHEAIRAIHGAQSCFGLLIISEQRETLTEYAMKNKLFTATVRCLCPVKVNTEKQLMRLVICLEISFYSTTT